MITIANPERYRAGLYERLSNENIEVASGEVVVSKDDELESGSISTQKIFNEDFVSKEIFIYMTTILMMEYQEQHLIDQTSIE